MTQRLKGEIMRKMMNNRYLAATLLPVVSALLLLAGCAASMAPPVPTTPVNTVYTIGPGDGLMIHVRNNPDLSVSVPVRPDGKISMPLVQSLEAAGKSPAELANDLERALSRYIRNPVVTVVVTSFQGAYSDQIRVVGQAAVPKAIPYQEGMTLLDVMIRVGGLTRFAAGDRATLVRKVNGERKTYGIDIQSLLSGDISENVPMRPGDIIIIPRSLL